jgi:hypothetical protein
MDEIQRLLDEVLGLSSHSRYSDETNRQCVGKLALAIKMLVNNLTAEEGDRQ